jgi:hypothetical protein
MPASRQPGRIAHPSQPGILPRQARRHHPNEPPVRQVRLARPSWEDRPPQSAGNPPETSDATLPDEPPGTTAGATDPPTSAPSREDRPPQPGRNPPKFHDANLPTPTQDNQGRSPTRVGPESSQFQRRHVLQRSPGTTAQCDRQCDRSTYLGIIPGGSPSPTGPESSQIPRRPHASSRQPGRIAHPTQPGILPTQATPPPQRSRPARPSGAARRLGWGVGLRSIGSTIHMFRNCGAD